MNAEVTAARPAATATGEALVAVRSAFKLGSSLIATWGVALGIRILLPRYLGPETFGVFNFADSFTATFFVMLGLGVDVYIHKEVPVRPEHASDFFGGVLLVRLALSALIMVAMAWVMRAAHRAPEVRQLVYVFALAQFVVILNNSLAALLHAERAVDGVAVLNVVSKIVWGVGIVLGLGAGYGLLAIALSLLASELLRAVALAYLARRHLKLRFSLDLAATFAVIVASLPFYLNTVAHTAYARLNVSMLSFLSSDLEVGLYGASSNLAGLALLITPLISWVLMPLISRAGARSEEDLNLLMRRAMELILIAAIPISLMLGVGADLWIRGAFGGAYAPATLGLRILAPMFVCTYVATVSAACLILLNRAWTVTLISLAGLLLNAALNFALIPPAHHRLGAGGAGSGAAVAMIATELLVAIALTLFLGRRAFDRRNALMLAKTLGACAVVIALDRLASGLGPARLVADVVVYVALVLGTGAVQLREMIEFVRSAIRSRSAHAL